MTGVTSRHTAGPDRIRIEPTEAQKKQVREETGEDAGAGEFTAGELEDRASPFQGPGPRA